MVIYYSVFYSYYSETNVICMDIYKQHINYYNQSRGRVETLRGSK